MLLFAFATDYHPSPDGIIAPGMHCSYTVAFTPDSLANYETELKVTAYYICVSSGSVIMRIAGFSVTRGHNENST